VRWLTAPGLRPAPAGRGSPFLNLFGGLGLLIAHGFSFRAFPTLAETTVVEYPVYHQQYFPPMPFPRERVVDARLTLLVLAETAVRPATITVLASMPVSAQVSSGSTNAAQQNAASNPPHEAP
jgi:hypothetical protein